MRTTVELPNELRARLLQLAAERGEKGFSRLVREALEKYLNGSPERGKHVREALAVLGKLDERTARELEESVKRIRKTWR